MSILNFDASDARAIRGKQTVSELEEVLTLIKSAALDGKDKVHIYGPWNYLETKEELEKKHFQVDTHPSIAIQKDNLYYTITW